MSHLQTTVDDGLMLRLRRLRHVALDMDGTIYSGATLFPVTIPFLSLLGRFGIGFTFLTNNSSKSSAEYLGKLRRLGIPVEQHQVYISTHATIEYLRAHASGIRKLFVLGTPGMREELREAGFDIATEDASDEPDAVVVAFDTGLCYSRLCRTAYWISQGKPYIATHPDMICPTDEPTVLVDCGAICAALQHATGRSPDIVPGKPDPGMLAGLMSRNQVGPADLAMVGDRLYTDMAMARASGALGVLVLTGESTLQQARAHSPAPELIVRDLEEFGQLLCHARQEHT